MRLIIEDYPEEGIAEIYFAFEGSYFPCERWTDFRRVLEVWNSGLFEDGSDDTLFFMDGPYRFDVQKMHQDAYLFSFYEESDDALHVVTRHVSTKLEYESLRQRLTRAIESQ